MQNVSKSLDDVRIYRFGAESDDNAHLKDGWAEPEQDFVWSKGKASVVRLPVAAGDSVLDISLWGYVPANTPAQETLIFVNGLLKGHFEVHAKTVIRLSCPHTSEGLEIVFYIPSARSPQSAEGLPDKRELGIALAVIQARTTPAA